MLANRRAIRWISSRSSNEGENRLRETAAEMQKRNEELTRLNRSMVGRELRMVGLKREINTLCAHAGQPQRYALDSGKEQQ